MGCGASSSKPNEVHTAPVEAEKPATTPEATLALVPPSPVVAEKPMLEKVEKTTSETVSEHALEVLNKGALAIDSAATAIGDHIDVAFEKSAIMMQKVEPCCLPHSPKCSPLSRDHNTSPLCYYADRSTAGRKGGKKPSGCISEKCVCGANPHTTLLPACLPGE